MCFTRLSSSKNIFQQGSEVIATYFNLGLSYSEILASLSFSHGVDLSSRQPKLDIITLLCRKFLMPSKKKFPEVGNLSAIDTCIRDSIKIIELLLKRKLSPRGNCASRTEEIRC